MIAVNFDSQTPVVPFPLTAPVICLASCPDGPSIRTEARGDSARAMLSQTALTTETQRNFRHLYADVGWFGVLSGSTLAFLSVYAARLGASPLQLGLLSAGPAAMNLLFSLPAGQWLRHRPFIRTAFTSSIWSRFAYLLMIPLPWLLSPAGETWALITLVIVMSVPGTLLAIAFNATFADVVPPEWRGHVVGRRNALLAVSITATSLICGVLLGTFAFPVNFQIVFALGCIGAAMSSFNIGRLSSRAVSAPRRVQRPLEDVARPGLMRFMDAVRPAAGLRFLTRGGRDMLRLDLLRGPYGPILMAYLLFHTAQYFSVPIFPLAWVQTLNLSDADISLGNALFYVAMLAASLPLGRLSARAGHRSVLLYGSLLYCLYPLLMGLAQSAPAFLLGSLIGGAVWALVNGGLFNYLMERIPKSDLPSHLGLYNLVLNVGVLVGSMSGPLVGQAIGLREALLIGAGLRLLSALVFAVVA